MKSTKAIATAMMAWAMLQGCARVPAPSREQAVRAGAAMDGGVSLSEARFEAVEGFDGGVFVQWAGPADGPPLVLVHGMGSQGARDFEPILPALSAQFRVMALDLPGLGRSQHVTGNYTPAEYARLIETLIARHFSQPIFLFGHSMGGALALQVAADIPEKVARLALLDVAGVLHYREYLREVVVGTEAQADPVKKSWRGIKRMFLKLGLAPLPAVRLEDAALESNPVLNSFFSTNGVIALQFLEHDFGPALRRVRAPVWLGWGAQDSVAPQRTAELLRATLKPQHDLLFLQSGHVPMRTEPERLAQSLLRFFTRKDLAPKLAAEPSALAVRSLREGVCERRRKQVFEGDYARIHIERCKEVTLRNVRARHIHIEKSQVELRDVSVLAGDNESVALRLKRARLKWTGGQIQAGTCIETERSVLDLAGVRCRYRDTSLRVRGPHTLRASVSALEREEDVMSLHGEYRIVGGEADEVTDVRFERLNAQEARLGSEENGREAEN